MIAQRVTPATFRLNAREEAIMRLLALGRSNVEIAAESGYSERSVANTIYEVYRDAGIPNRVSALRWMLERDPDLVDYIRTDWEAS